MRTILATAALAATLLACAQGGSAPQPVATVAAPPAPSATPTALKPSTEPAAGQCGIARFEALATLKLNAYRNAGARCGRAGQFASAAPLRWDDRLARAALQHTQDMARHKHFDHTGRDGREPSQRVDAAGYAWAATRENIALGADSLEEVMAMWINSPGHCANMMASEMRDFGLACIGRDAGSPYWTLVLGRAR